MDELPELPELPPELLEQRFPGGFSIRDEANAIVAMAFRNGPLEGLHAGKRSKLLQDDSLSRITQAEMKELMLYASEHVAAFLLQKERAPERYDWTVKAYNIMFCSKWKR